MAKLAVQIFKYMLIVLGGIACLGIIGCAVLVIFPSATIFGVSYSSGNAAPIENRHVNSGNFALADTVEFKTNGYGIRLREMRTEDNLPNEFDFGTRLYKQFAGFVYGDTRTPALSTGYDADTKVFTFEVSEPVGFVNNTNTYLEVYLRSTSLLASKTLLLTTTSGKVDIGLPITGSSKNLEIGNAIVNTGHGSTKFTNAIIKDKLTVNKTGGEITVDKNIGGTADILMSAGLTRITLLGVAESGKSTGSDFGLEINASNADIKVTKVWNDGFKLDAGGGLVNIAEINGDVSVDMTAGCELHITTIQGASSVAINGTGGALTIGEVNCDVVIYKTSGSVTITKALGEVDIENVNGNITITEANKEVTAVSERGNINITGKDDKAFKITTTNNYGTTTIKKARGVVDAKIRTNGPGTINVEFLQVVGASEIQSNIGQITISINISFAAAEPFYLIWDTQSASIDVWGTETTLSKSEAGILGAEDTCADKITVATTRHFVISTVS
ncbi:MAG: hypothetical protein FWE53_00370 [Firmicutes bacterium]|nr:hypothetical protein [Bacillota bacterium]